MEKKKGLSLTTIWLMIGVAFFFDAIQDALLPLGIGYFAPILFYPTFTLWFFLHEENFLSLRTGPSLLIGTIIEFVPGPDILPGFTVMVARAAFAARVKDGKPHQESTDGLSKAA